VGAMIVSIAVAELVFGVVLVGGILLWWPDVPWGPLTVAGVAVNAVIPVVFYPWSKTIWMAVDVLLHRMDIRDRGAEGNGDATPRVFDRRTLRG
jgi:hypothetical protein